MRKLSTLKQIVISSSTVIGIAILCFLFRNWLGDYHNAAMVLLVSVSFFAVIFDIIPVLIAATLSALIWNFSFIPPLFTFHISSGHDIIMFCMYFFIAFVSAVLTVKIRSTERKLLKKQREENTILLYNTLLNSLSHELKTPIATIQGSIDTLQESKSRLSEQQNHELLTEIDLAANRLHRQVENLLNMSRVESGTLAPKNDWTDLSDLIHRIVQKIPIRYTQKIQILGVEALPLFMIDEVFLEQIISNLLLNAISYSHSDSTIRLTVDHEEDNLLFTIEDNGPGFPEDQIHNVFNKFFRLPNTKVGGSGLGLSIVKGFTEAMHGQITLHNNPSGGARFVVEIPAKTSYINKLKNE